MTVIIRGLLSGVKAFSVKFPFILLLLFKISVAVRFAS